MIISLHLPKTAGTSFSGALQAHFGDALVKDYEDRPITAPVLQRNRHALESGLRNADKKFDDVECIHGHFLPVKYLLLASRQEIEFVTWLRDPVARLLSHYHYWRSTYDPGESSRLHKTVVEEDWSLERFCLGPEVRNLYGQYLWAFPATNFDFIGITEFYDEDLNYFAKHFLGTRLENHRVNETSRDGGQPLEAELRKKIETFHRADMELYRWALEKRKARE